MPLMHGSDKHVIASNIQEMVKSGHPHKSAVAAAMKMAKKPKKKSKLKAKYVNS
jgi:hypothetical protein